MYKFEIKFSLPLILTSFPLVLVVLLFLAGGYEFYQEMALINMGGNQSLESDEKVFKIDLQASMELSGVKNKSIKGLGVDDSEIYILKVSKEKKGLSSLFSKLKKQRKEKTYQIVNNSKTTIQKTSLPNYNAFLNADDKKQMGEQAIKKIIHSNKHLFKGCYNRMLVKDGLLAGIVTIIISTDGSGRSMFKGIGRTKVIRELKRCLNTQVRKVDFSSINLTKKVRFSLNFSS